MDYRPTSRLKRYLKRELANNRPTCPRGSECPRCGECEIDRLVWDNDQVTCRTCYAIYTP